MKIEKNELSGKIGQLKSIVPSRTTIEALKGVLCADGYLIASDTNLTVKAKLEGIEEETEPFIIPAKAFDFINSLPDGELDISIKSGNIVIKTGKIKNQFKTLDAALFAYTKSIDTEAEPAKISALKLKKAIDHVLYAVATNGNNQQMTGMFLECKGGKLNFEGDISIYHDENGTLFKSDGYEVYTRIIQGEYFKYEAMFKSGDIFTIINRKVLMDAINRARLCGSAEDKAPVIMNMSGDTIGITYRSVMADFHEDIPVMEPFEKDLKIAFDPRLMMDSLKAFECDTVTMELTSAKFPALIKADDSDMTALVLPVNFKEA